MKRTISKSAATTAAIALIATPAFAAPGGQGKGADKEPAGKGQATAPAKLCKGLPKKKSGEQKKSPFAACVSGAKKAQRELERNAKREAAGEQPKELKAPGQICKAQPRKKVGTQKKSLFAACVKGVVTARKQAREAEQEQGGQEQTEQEQPVTQS